MNNFETALKQINWSNILSSKEVENSCKTFLTTINKVMSSFTRKVQYKPRHKNTLPWLNENIRQQMKDRDLALKRALKSGNSTVVIGLTLHHFEIR